MATPVVRRGHARYPVAVDNTLAFMDQASFLWVRASGHVHGVQFIWVYQRDIDVEGLGRTHDNLAHGLIGRRIECSPFPLGRHRWVSCHESPGIDIAPAARTHAALPGWVDERAQIPVDPEFGPCWHLGVLPIEDYGTAVSLVASHTVMDGAGLCLAVRDAVKGGPRWPVAYVSPKDCEVRPLLADRDSSAAVVPVCGGRRV